LESGFFPIAKALTGASKAVVIFASPKTVAHSLKLRLAVMTTLVALHHNPSLRSFAERLCKVGKPRKVIITAVARNLVTIANALCRNRQNWTAPKT
jgi:hypothetical protein